MTKERRPLHDWERDECAALKKAIAEYNSSRPKDKRLTQDEIAHAVGMSQGTLGSHLNGHRPLTQKLAVAMSEMLGVPIGAFSKRIEQDIARMATVAGISPAADVVERIPPRSFDLRNEPGYTGVLQLTARGSTGDGDDNPHVEIRGVMAFRSSWLRANNLNQRHLDVIYANGHSMEPTINDGDVLLVDESKIEPKDGQIFAMQSATKGTIVKRLVKSDIEGWIIRSDNSDKARYGDEILRDGEINEVRIIGRVVWRGGML
ncbi:LexA family transcriptional regulator [Pseudomonas atacamensis]|uniref:LexA family transcriptional regulator n=1 Tax=Pseudomonas atacamensis TaxID=2565368 RepID=UPI00300F2FEA